MNFDTAIINFNSSNLHSVKSACNYVGIKSIITNRRKDIINSKSIIIPGVGAFNKAIDKIKSLDLDKVIKEFADSNKPIFGICLGMQLLFEYSEEFNKSFGLGILKGKVKKINNFKKEKINFPVPHIGWNKIEKNNEWKGTILEDNKNFEYMYFVHSFHVIPSDRNIILAKTKYGEANICSVIRSNNIYATQFHPEKSGEQGLKIYKNFKKIIKNNI